MVSGCPLLHLVHQLVNYWLDQGASLDLEEWVSIPPSWSDGLHHYWSDQGHVWTQMSGYPLPHPGLTPAQTGRTRGHLWTWKSGCPLLHPGPTACITTGLTRGMSGLG